MSSDDKPADEPRAVDVVTGNVSEEDLDPETIAQLARWFGFGAPPDGEPEPEPEPENPELVAAREARQRATDAVDPALVAQLEQWKVAGDPLIRLPPPMEVTPDPSLAKFDLDVWGLRFVGDVREVERPEDVDHALTERAPQALLRDLHRPVKYFGDIFMEMVDTGLDIGGRIARQAVTEAITTTYTVDIFEHTPKQWIFEDYAERHERIGVPWETLSAHKESDSLPTEALERHFGKPKK